MTGIRNPQSVIGGDDEAIVDSFDHVNSPAKPLAGLLSFVGRDSLQAAEAPIIGRVRGMKEDKPMS